VAEFSSKPIRVTVVESNPNRVELVIGGEHFVYRTKASAAEQKPSPSSPPRDAGVVMAPMPGRVTGALVREGEQVKAGDPLVTIESMKMEVAVRADRDGVVTEILAKEGAAVKRGQGLVRLT
jgi:biotin carboxyl carrier protein